MLARERRKAAAKANHREEQQVVNSSAQRSAGAASNEHAEQDQAVRVCKPLAHTERWPDGSAASARDPRHGVKTRRERPPRSTGRITGQSG